MKVSAKSKERVLAPEGVHAARCIRILDLGTQYSARWNKSTRKVELSFELVDERHVFDEEKGEQPFILHRRYTASLSKRSSLYKDIQAWTGKKFGKNEEFDLNDLLGEPCQVQVTHDEGEEGDIYANIGAIMAPGKLKVRQAESELVSFSLDDFDEDVFGSLPEFLQDVIMESPEYKKATERPARSAAPARREAPERSAPAKRPAPAPAKRPAPAKAKARR